MARLSINRGVEGPGFKVSLYFVVSGSIVSIIPFQPLKETDEDADHLYDDMNGLNVGTNSFTGRTGTTEPILSDSVSKLNQEVNDADPTCLGISEIPFPSEVDLDQSAAYEDVSLMPLPTNSGPQQSTMNGNSTVERSVDEGKAEVEISASLKKREASQEIKLNTLKKDGTLKKDLTEKKSASLDKKDNTMRRNTIKKSDNATVTNTTTSARPSVSHAINLEKEFAELDKVKTSLLSPLLLLRVRFENKKIFLRMP